MQVGSARGARKDPEEYWKEAMESHPMPRATKGAVFAVPNCDITEEAPCKKKAGYKLPKDFERTVEKAFVEGLALGLKYDGAGGEEKSFVKDFDTTPNVSIYND